MKKIAALLGIVLLTLVLLVSCSTYYFPPDGDKTDREPDSDSESTTLDTAPLENFEPDRANVLESCVYLIEGDSHDLLYERVGEGNGEIEWSSSSDAVSVKDGTVTALKTGFAQISGGGEGVCTVRVLPKKMPTVSIDTDGVAVTSRTEYVPCVVDLESDVAAFCLDDEVAEIRVRGNSTSTRPKKPYRIRFSSKTNLMGLNGGAECRSWVLLAEHYDDSMIRNASAFCFAASILREYSSDFCYVNLVLNGEYVGVYLLAEQSQIQQNRIDIEEAGEDSSALASGYLFELDASTNPPDFYIAYDGLGIENFMGEAFTLNLNDVGMPRMFYSIKNNGLSQEQKTFAKNYLSRVFQIVYAATYQGISYEFDAEYRLVRSTKSPEDAIRAVIDVDSLARKYIHSEIFCNGDEHKKSFFMYVDLSKDGTGKLTFTCPWDFDTAFVGWASYNYRDPEVYYACTRNLWYVMAVRNEWFREEVSTLWNELYLQNGGYDACLDLIQDVTVAYQREFLNDSEKWNRAESQPYQAQKTHDWLVTRINWLNKHIGENQFLVD